MVWLLPLGQVICRSGEPRGRALGDYPPLDQVLAELATILAAPTAA